jgi:4-aminobutyrate aminotransferase-like enzyme
MATAQAPLDQLGGYMVANTAVDPVIVSGSGATVTDEAGKVYIDLEAGPGVVSVGHCHPHVVAAIRDQAGRLMQSPGRFHSRLSLTLAQRISDLTDGHLKRAFIANSGAEANDGAIKIALKHAVRSGKEGLSIFAFDHGFHGRTSVGLSLSGLAGRKRGFGQYASFPGIVHLPAPYLYRHGERDYFGEIELAMKTRVAGDAAILISEPIWCVGGVFAPPKDFWPRVAELCRKHGITLIFDEVFGGFGRTGRMFSHEHFGVRPDIMTFAKAIGGGLPLAGYIATEEVGSALVVGDHFTTFGTNNQVGIAAGHAVLDVLEAEQLPARAARGGERFLAGLERLKAQHPAIGDVRGFGLMIGVELVKDRTTREPAPELAKAVQAEMLQRGVLASLTGIYGCVLRITPPLVITDDQIDQSVRVIGEALEAATS